MYVTSFIAAVPWRWFCMLVCFLSLTLTRVCTRTYTAIFPRIPITVFILLRSAGAVKHLHTKGEHLGKDGSTIKACVCECVNVCERKEVANEIETCYIFLWRF